PKEERDGSSNERRGDPILQERTASGPCNTSDRARLQAFQIGAKFRGRRMPRSTILFQKLADDSLQLGRDFRITRTRRLWRLIQQSVNDYGQCRTVKRAKSGRHFVKNDAERPKVAPRIYDLAASLLRRHICDCTNCRARLSERVYSSPFCFPTLILLCKPEIEHLGIATCSNQNVLRLNVAMDDSFAVGCVQR